MSRTLRIAALAAAILALYMLQPAAANPLPYTITTNTSDTNGDGIPDPSAGIAGGMTCGCYCAVTTTTVDLQAVGQDVYVYNQDGGCTMDRSATVTSGDVDPYATPSVTYSSTCWGPCPE
ncbi:MAG: hypothetical protein V4510_02110 [bacterium]